MDFSQINLETILVVVISLITLNLLFIGFYIINVLRELKKTISKAHEMIDDVDRSVKDGIDKVVSIEKPLQALTHTANAIAGFFKGADAIKQATQSFQHHKSESSEGNYSSTSVSSIDLEVSNDSNDEISAEKKPPEKPRLFKSLRKSR